MAKRRRFGRARGYYSRAKHRASKMTLPVAPLMGIIFMPAVWNTAEKLIQGDMTGAASWAKQAAGLNTSNQFDLNVVKANYMPVIAGVLIHKAAGFLGVNKVLARAKIPLIRV